MDEHYNPSTSPPSGKVLDHMKSEADRLLDKVDAAQAEMRQEITMALDEGAPVTEVVSACGGLNKIAFLAGAEKAKKLEDMMQEESNRRTL